VRTSYRFGLSHPVFIQRTSASYISDPLSPRTTCRRYTDVNETNNKRTPTQNLSGRLRPYCVYTQRTHHIHTQKCISKHHLARRLPSRYLLASRLAGWLRLLDPSTATTRSSQTRVVDRAVPTHHGQQARHSAIATRHRPSSRTPTFSARTSTTRTRVPS
jgi:hypothetical protein